MSLIPIRGLLKLMEKETPNFFFEDYRLGEESLVIDGNSVMKKVYENMRDRHDCFGGNYDFYANEVRQFFAKLNEVKITPYVTLFGGAFVKPPPRAISELQQMINKALEVTPNSDSHLTQCPLWLRQVFVDVLVELRIKKVQFDFQEATSATIIARYLSAPVLGDDPNYYIYDVKYIPFDSVKFSKPDVTLKTDPTTSQRRRHKYFHCKVLNTTKLQEYLRIPSENKHHLPYYVAVLSCEEHYQTEMLDKLISQLEEKEIAKAEVLQSTSATEVIKRVTDNIEHLMLEEAYSEHPESAYIIENVYKLMNSYGCAKSVYLKYLGITIDGRDLSSSIVPTITSKPDIFSEKSRNCLFPPEFIDLIKTRKCYLPPQIECPTLAYTHAVSYDMISALYKILTESSTHFSLFVRNNTVVAEKILSSYRYDITSLASIQNMKRDKRRRILSEVVISTNEEELKVLLDSVPENWKLFLIAMKIYINYHRNWPMVYAMIMCKLVLTAVDGKLGFYRTQDAFRRQFDGVVMHFKSEPPPMGSTTSVSQLLEKISFEESMIVMDKVVKNFEMAPELRSNPEQFDRVLAHRMCEFQSCLLHVQYLNDILNSPYTKCEMSKIYNGTFIYNLTNEINKSKLSFQYIVSILKDAPIVSKIFHQLVDDLEASCKLIV